MQPSIDTRPVPERLTWREICARYPDQWVVMVDLDPIDDISCDIRTAVVFLTAPNRSELRRKIGALDAAGYTSSARAFTGRLVPEGYISMRFYGL